MTTTKPAKSSVKKTTRTNWRDLYLDLPTHVAEALRNARLKPEQIVVKEDGELMAIESITAKDVESIRLLYNADTVSDTVTPGTASTTPVIPSLVEGSHSTESVGVDPRVAPESVTVEETKLKKVYPPRQRGQKYQAMSKQIKKNELYSIPKAVEILTKLAQSTKLKTVELTLNTTATGLRGELKLPHSTGKELKIAIFSDKVAAQIEKGKFDFSILLATPADMPKLARLAKVLGPKGLMPNPKSGTVTENPAKRLAELTAGGTLPYKTEAKFPIIHLALGKIDQDQNDLSENITEALKGVGVTKIKSAYLACTHTPSVRLQLGTL